MIFLALVRFNRNIVECKDAIRFTSALMNWDLIETLWNVKLQEYDAGEAAAPRFNRNIVECKDQWGITVTAVARVI